MVMKYTFWVFAFFFGGIIGLNAQQLSGKIIDAETGEGLFDVKVMKFDSTENAEKPGELVLDTIIYEKTNEQGVFNLGSAVSLPVTFEIKYPAYGKTVHTMTENNQQFKIQKSSMPTIMWLIACIIVTAFTVYFFIKVLRTPGKKEEDYPPGP